MANILGYVEDCHKASLERTKHLSVKNLTQNNTNSFESIHTDPDLIAADIDFKFHRFSLLGHNNKHNKNGGSSSKKKLKDTSNADRNTSSTSCEKLKNVRRSKGSSDGHEKTNDSSNENYNINNASASKKSTSAVKAKNGKRNTSSSKSESTNRSDSLQLTKSKNNFQPTKNSKRKQQKKKKNKDDDDYDDEEEEDDDEDELHEYSERKRFLATKLSKKESKRQQDLLEEENEEKILLRKHLLLLGSELDITCSTTNQELLHGEAKNYKSDDEDDDDDDDASYSESGQATSVSSSSSKQQTEIVAATAIGNLSEKNPRSSSTQKKSENHNMPSAITETNNIDRERRSENIRDVLLMNQSNNNDIDPNSGLPAAPRSQQQQQPRSSFSTASWSSFFSRLSRQSMLDVEVEAGLSIVTRLSFPYAFLFAPRGVLFRILVVVFCVISGVVMGALFLRCGLADPSAVFSATALANLLFFKFVLSRIGSGLIFNGMIEYFWSDFFNRTRMRWYQSPPQPLLAAIGGFCFGLGVAVSGIHPFFAMSIIAIGVPYAALYLVGQFFGVLIFVVLEMKYDLTSSVPLLPHKEIPLSKLMAIRRIVRKVASDKREQEVRQKKLDRQSRLDQKLMRTVHERQNEMKKAELEAKKQILSLIRKDRRRKRNLPQDEGANKNQKNQEDILSVPSQVTSGEESSAKSSNDRLQTKEKKSVKKTKGKKKKPQPDDDNNELVILAKGLGQEHQNQNDGNEEDDDGDEDQDDTHQNNSTKTTTSDSESPKQTLRKRKEAQAFKFDNNITKASTDGGAQQSGRAEDSVLLSDKNSNINKTVSSTPGENSNKLEANNSEEEGGDDDDDEEEEEEDEEEDNTNRDEVEKPEEKTKNQELIVTTKEPDQGSSNNTDGYSTRRAVSSRASSHSKRTSTDGHDHDLHDRKSKSKTKKNSAATKPQKVKSKRGMNPIRSSNFNDDDREDDDDDDDDDDNGDDDGSQSVATSATTTTNTGTVTTASGAGVSGKSSSRHTPSTTVAEEQLRNSSTVKSQKHQRSKRHRSHSKQKATKKDDGGDISKREKISLFPAQNDATKTQASKTDHLVVVLENEMSDLSFSDTSSQRRMKTKLRKKRAQQMLQVMKSKRVSKSATSSCFSLSTTMADPCKVNPSLASSIFADIKFRTRFCKLSIPIGLVLLGVASFLQSGPVVGAVDFDKVSSIAADVEDLQIPGVTTPVVLLAAVHAFVGASFRFLFRYSYSLGDMMKFAVLFVFSYYFPSISARNNSKATNENNNNNNNDENDNSNNKSIIKNTSNNNNNQHLQLSRSRQADFERFAFLVNALAIGVGTAVMALIVGIPFNSYFPGKGQILDPANLSGSTAVYAVRATAGGLLTGFGIMFVGGEQAVLEGITELHLKSGFSVFCVACTAILFGIFASSFTTN